MSRLRTLKKQIRRKNDILNSFMGSAILTAAILTNTSEDEAGKFAREFKKNILRRGDITVRKVFKTAFEAFKKSEIIADALISSAILLYDNSELLSPRVTLYVNGRALPLNKDGIEFGIIGEFNKEEQNPRFNISAEPLFDSLEDYINEDTIKFI